ncbi:hypothetical protein OS493_012128 [Desmophyllum pertusum]|uniref:Uncharacterized protein n=1 Tax=Desmophyllum pertusum TaxID=174260 RepID=A0A9X0A2W8_9CNID|nr:hypothetical protein OS493_012128 [Desmophyllum pertusum]
MRLYPSYCVNHVGRTKALKKDFAELRQLYSDAQERYSDPARSTSQAKIIANNKIKDGTEDPRQDLISQLEKSQEKMMELERDKLAISDEKAEIAIEVCVLHVPVILLPIK